MVLPMGLLEALSSGRVLPICVQEHCPTHVYLLKCLYFEEQNSHVSTAGHASGQAANDSQAGIGRKPLPWRTAAKMQKCEVSSLGPDC